MHTTVKVASACHSDSHMRSMSICAVALSCTIPRQKQFNLLKKVTIFVFDYNQINIVTFFNKLNCF